MPEESTATIKMDATPTIEVKGGKVVEALLVLLILFVVCLFAN